MTLETTALAIAALLAWVALVHLVVGSGVRVGELVWSGRQPRLLDPGLRARSFIYAILLILSGLVLAIATNAIGWDPIPEQWMRSATFTVTAFLGVSFIYSLFWGSRWERMLFAPITLLGAVFAGWLTFG
ncbi:MAG TPA: hypothetical protein VJ948_11085 [Acidimicrobiia bacterium]|nr:hypothetical protein [Acidimicrobiia bacterium]